MAAFVASDFRRFVSATRAGLLLALIGLLPGAGVTRAAPGATEGTPAIASEGNFSQRHARDRLAILKMLSSGTIPNPLAFDAYYADFFREFAHRGNAGRLPEMRRQLSIDLALSGRAKIADAHDRLARRSLAVMKELAADPARHAATRLNAALVIGSLNDRERSAAARIPATPMAQALPILLAFSLPPAGPTNGAEDSVRIAALVGISRHAESVIDEEPTRQKVLRQMANLLEQRQLPAGRTDAGHDWLRRRAVDVLGHCVEPKASSLDAKTFWLLVAMIAEPTTSDRLRITAVDAVTAIIERSPIETGQLADILSSTKRLAANLAAEAVSAASDKSAGPTDVALERHRLNQNFAVLSALANRLAASAAPAAIQDMEAPTSFREFSAELNQCLVLLANADMVGGAWTQPVARIARRWDVQSNPVTSTGNFDQ